MLLTVEEVAERLKCGKNAVYKLINAGKLPHLKLGRIKVREETLEEFTKKWEGWDITDPENPVKLEETA